MAVAKKSKRISVDKVESERAAEAALSRWWALKKEIERIRITEGIPELEAEIDRLRSELVDFMVSNEIERIDTEGMHGTLVKAMYGGRFIGHDDDLLPDDRANVIPLWDILTKKYKGNKRMIKVMWDKITRPVVMSELVEEAVSAGELTVDEVAAAWTEKEKKPFIRLFEDD